MPIGSNGVWSKQEAPGDATQSQAEEMASRWFGVEMSITDFEVPQNTTQHRCYRSLSEDESNTAWITLRTEKVTQHIQPEIGHLSIPGETRVGKWQAYEEVEQVRGCSIEGERVHVIILC
jgi:hypothetical protein